MKVKIINGKVKIVPNEGCIIKKREGNETYNDGLEMTRGDHVSYYKSVTDESNIEHSSNLLQQQEIHQGMD